MNVFLKQASKEINKPLNDKAFTPPGVNESNKSSLKRRPALYVYKLLNNIMGDFLVCRNEPLWR